MGSAAQDRWTEAVADLPRLALKSEVKKLLRIGDRKMDYLLARGQIRGVRGVQSGSSKVLIPRTEVSNYLRGLAGEK